MAALLPAGTLLSGALADELTGALLDAGPLAVSDVDGVVDGVGVGVSDGVSDGVADGV